MISAALKAPSSQSASPRRATIWFNRHVSIYRDNPNGMPAQFNPNVGCAHHRGGTTHGVQH
jgi:hypothetical protein